MKKKRKPYHTPDGKPIRIPVLADGHNILSTDQLSARWGGQVLPGTLENWRSAGMGPKFVKFGKGRSCRVVYRLEAVEEYERSNEITPKA